MMTKQGRRGFSMVVLTVVLAVMSIAAVTIMNLVGLELDMIGEHRRAFEAQGTAEAALIETINSRTVAMATPTFTTPGLKYSFSAPQTSALKDDVLGTDYNVEIRLLRVAPMPESSINWSRALVYEITARSEAARQSNRGEVVGEVFRLVSLSPGTVLPQLHGR